jgi:hypothetical protein
MVWFLLVTTIFLEPAGGYKAGDTYDSIPVGYSVSEQDCRDAGEIVAGYLSRGIPYKTLAVYSCTKIDRERLAVISEEYNWDGLNN